MLLNIEKYNQDRGNVPMGNSRGYLIESKSFEFAVGRGS
jgi:hypothetical protein